MKKDEDLPTSSLPPSIQSPQTIVIPHLYNFRKTVRLAKTIQLKVWNYLEGHPYRDTHRSVHI